MEDGSMQTRILMRDKKNNNKDREEVEIVMTLIVLAEDLLERWYCTDWLSLTYELHLAFS